MDKPHILPTEEFFPDPYDQSEQAVEAMCARICQYMQVPADLVDLTFFSSRNVPHLVNEDGRSLGRAVGTFSQSEGRYNIRIDRGLMDQPLGLAGTIAHELSHARLLGEDRIDRDCFDHELTTDLNVVFHGLGLFIANHPGHSVLDACYWPGSQQPAPTYMTGAMISYAMALRCVLRMEPFPHWRKHLKPAMRSEFKQAYRHLAHAGQGRQ